MSKTYRYSDSFTVDDIRILQRLMISGCPHKKPRQKSGVFLQGISKDPMKRDFDCQQCSKLQSKLRFLGFLEVPLR